MDPRANVEEQVELARQITAWVDRRDGDVAIYESMVRLAELVEALHEWRCEGGFDPYAQPATDAQLFLVENGNAHVVTRVIGGGDRRERAKQQARKWLWDNPDQYAVSPLTEPGDRIHLDITVQV